MDSLLLTAFVAEDEDAIDVEAPPSVEVPPTGRQRFHTNRLTGETPVVADFQGGPPEHEPEPARHSGKEASGEATSHAPAPAQESPPSGNAGLSEDDELRRQELIDHVKEQLGQDLTAKALEDVGGLILKNAALLGDATPHLSKLYADKKQAMSHGEPPANGGRRSRF
jgi:hypothetical protein